MTDAGPTLIVQSERWRTRLPSSLSGLANVAEIWATQSYLLIRDGRTEHQLRWGDITELMCSLAGPLRFFVWTPPLTVTVSSRGTPFATPGPNFPVVVEVYGVRRDVARSAADRLVSLARQHGAAARIT